jgi:hypothetical protein
MVEVTELRRLVWKLRGVEIVMIVSKFEVMSLSGVA